MHFPHDNQGQTQLSRATTHSSIWGARIEFFKGLTESLEDFKWEINSKLRGFRPRFDEVPALLEMAKSREALNAYGGLQRNLSWP
jgi:hypothetical protein